MGYTALFQTGAIINARVKYNYGTTFRCFNGHESTTISKYCPECGYRIFESSKLEDLEIFDIIGEYEINEDSIKIKMTIRILYPNPNQSSN